MANDRLWLGSIPAGICIFLGKTMSVGYYKAPSAEALNTFYDMVQDNTVNKGMDIEDFFVFTEASFSFVAAGLLNTEYNIRELEVIGYE